MALSMDVALLDSAARTVSGSGAAIDLGVSSGLRLDLIVTAMTAGASLVVEVQTSRDGAAWRPLGLVGSLSSVGYLTRALAGADRYVRATWTIRGTAPSVTFSLGGQAQVVYCTPDEVTQLGVAPEALANIDPSVLADHLLTNTDDINDKLCKRFKLPLAKWPQSLRKHLAAITCWTVLSHRGVNPNTGDSDIQKRHDKAWKDVLDVAENRAGSPDGYVDSTPSVTEDGTYTFSRPRRR